MINRTPHTMTRRHLAAAALVTPFLPSAASTAMGEDPDAALSVLCAEYDRLQKIIRATPDLDDDRWDALFAEQTSVVDQIEAITPCTSAGLAHKIRIIADNDGGGDENVMRRLVADAAAVAGVG
ncbi:hypothetical protein [Thalassobaculum sp.]|uniref:hypothetical protein n=1 Tax=Thalassobaculum sp. TaxID=2022740 RepID=UPI003B5AC8D2